MKYRLFNLKSRKTNIYSLVFNLIVQFTVIIYVLTLKFNQLKSYKFIIILKLNQYKINNF